MLTKKVWERIQKIAILKSFRAHFEANAKKVWERLPMRSRSTTLLGLANNSVKKVCANPLFYLRTRAYQILNILTKFNDVIFQCLRCHSCQFKSQKFSSFFDVLLCPPTLKTVLPPMRRLPVRQVFRTWMKALLHCGYKYLLNLLISLVVTYKTKLS